MQLIAGYPGNDAAIVIETRGTMVLLDLLAKGNYQKKSQGQIVGYVPRNPDRDRLFNHIIDRLGSKRTVCTVVGVASGKGGLFHAAQFALSDGASLTEFYRKGGNFRFSMWIDLAEVSSSRALLKELALSEIEHKPVETKWPDELSIPDAQAQSPSPTAEPATNSDERSVAPQGQTDANDVWAEVVKPRLRRGTRMSSRTGKEYELISFDEESFTIQRLGETSTVKITRKRIQKNAARLATGEHLLFQKNPKQGGISYTVAEEIGVVWALGNAVRQVSDGYVAGPLLVVTGERSISRLTEASAIAPYTDAPEDIATAPPSAPEPDPDAIGRGWSEHNRTQNALAAFLRQHAMTPKKAQGTPRFDIAWEDDDEFYVGEVKSITSKNEEGQLRKGLGQVLRYRHQLSNKAVVHAVLIASRIPEDQSWVGACADAGVILLWPGAFEKLLG